MHPPFFLPRARLCASLLFLGLVSPTCSQGAELRAPMSAMENAQDALAWDFHLSLGSAHPVRLTCTEQGGEGEQHVLDLLSAADHTVTLRGLKAATRYRCEAAPSDTSPLEAQTVSLITAPLPFDLKTPDITVPSTNVAETGYTLYNYGIYRGGFKNNYLVILDAKGQVRWYLSGPGAGDVDASYLGSDKILYGGMSATYYPPTLVGLDKVVQWKGTTEVSVPYENVGQVNHDAHLSADGKSIFLMNYATLDSYYLVFLVKQIDLATNKVVWVWDSIADGLQKGELPPGTGSSSDLYHANAVMDQWENGKLYLYVSLRNLHKVLKIDYATKAVVWQLGVGGDFTLLEANGTPAASHRWFFHQHDVQVHGPNLLSAYDNGTARSSYGGTNYTRGLQLILDQTAMTAKIGFEYKETGWVEAYWGGYDVLDNGSSLIAMGHFASGGGTHYSALVQVSSTGTVIWRADFKSDKDAVYRAERIDGCSIFNNVDYCPQLLDGGR